MHIILFGYCDAAHLNISRFANNFKNTNVLESGRLASELDFTYLKKAATVIMHMATYFQGLFAMGTPDTSVISIIPKPSAPLVLVV